MPVILVLLLYGVDVGVVDSGCIDCVVGSWYSVCVCVCDSGIVVVSHNACVDMCIGVRCINISIDVMRCECGRGELPPQLWVDPTQHGHVPDHHV